MSLSWNLKSWKQQTTAWFCNRRRQVGVQRTSHADTFQIDWDDINLKEESAKPAAVTLMGPPKEYLGEAADRHAYVLFDAITLLRKHGFTADFPLLEQVQRKPAWKFNRKQSKVPGIFGRLINEVSPATKIVVRAEEDEVAYLSFMSFSQPWLNVLCVSTEDHMVTMINTILSKRFVLVRLLHEVNKIPVYTSDLNLIGKTGFSVTMATSEANERRELLTRFVLRKEGCTICRAIWSFQNLRLDSVGPTLEVFEVATEWRELGLDQLLLATMEHKMTDMFNPLVAFHLKVRNINDPAVMAWFVQRGYYADRDHKGGACLCKVFAMF